MSNQGNDFDWNKVPTKAFVDTFTVRIIGGIHHLCLKSGRDESCFVFSLPLSKMMARGILKQVEEIEVKNSITFDARLPDEPMLSPWTSQKPPEDSASEKKS